MTTAEGRIGAGDVLNLVREVGPTSRTNLARLAGVAVSTVSLRVEKLIADGLVEEVGEGISTGGRRPRMLQVRSGGSAVLAIDLGSHHARLGVMDLSNRPLAVISEPVQLDDGPEAVLELISTRLEKLLEGMANCAVRGVGIAVPGPVDPASGRVVSPSRMPGWHDFAVAQWLSDRFKAPSVVDNDANLLALGEFRSKRSRDGTRHLIAVKVGRGIGCGVIASGALHYGGIGAAGDITHVDISGTGGEETRLCSCGKRGCLETVASGAALLDELADEGDPASDLSELVQRVRRGDPMANMAVRTAGRHLGEVLAVVVNFFNPQVLVLGGILSEADPLVAAVRAAIYERCLPMASQSVDICVTALGPDATLVGASARILDQLTEAGVN